MLNANLNDLQKMHGKDEGLRAMREIADLGGFGSIGDGEGQISSAYAGGLDVAGVLSDSNTAVSEKAKERIAELCGEKRREQFATTSSAHKMQKEDK